MFSTTPKPPVPKETPAEAERILWGPRAWKNKQGKIPVTKDFLAEVKRLGGLGLTRTQVHQFFGVVDSTWTAMNKKHPEIDALMNEGKAEKIGIASGKLWEAIEKGNLSAIIFFLKTQGRWRETDPSADGNADKPAFPAITLTVNDPIEAARIYQQIMIGS